MRRREIREGRKEGNGWEKIRNKEKDEKEVENWMREKMNMI